VSKHYEYRETIAVHGHIWQMFAPYGSDNSVSHMQETSSWKFLHVGVIGVHDEHEQVAMHPSVFGCTQYGYEVCEVWLVGKRDRQIMKPSYLLGLWDEVAL